MLMPLLLSTLAGAGPCEGFDPGEHTVRSVLSGPVLDVEVDASGTVWAGVGGQLVQIDGEQVRRHGLPGASPHTRTWGVQPASDGAVWVAADGGLHRFREGVWEARYALPGERIPQSLAVDGDGRVWLGMYKEGLWTLAPGEDALSQVWRGPGSLASDVYDIEVVDDGVLAVTRSGLRHFTPAGGMTDVSGVSLYKVRRAPDGRLWATDYGSLHLLHGGADGWTEVKTRHPRMDFDYNGTITYISYALDLLPSGGVVVGTQFTGVTACWDGETWHVPTLWEDRERAMVRAITHDAEGRVWIARQDGLWVLTMSRRRRARP